MKHKRNDKIQTYGLDAQCRMKKYTYTFVKYTDEVEGYDCLISRQGMFQYSKSANFIGPNASKPFSA